MTPCPAELRTERWEAPVVRVEGRLEVVPELVVKIYPCEVEGEHEVHRYRGMAWL